MDEIRRGSWVTPNADDPQYLACLAMEAGGMSFENLSDCMWEHEQQGHAYHARLLAWTWKNRYPVEAARAMGEPV